MRKQQAASTESTKSQRLGNGVTMSFANNLQSRGLQCTIGPIGIKFIRFN